MNFGQPCDIDLWVMKWRSAWPIFQGPLILPYILKTIWCMNITLWDYESVWPENKCIFHGSVILPYILKTIWCMNIILRDYQSVLPDVWPQNIVAHYDLYFMVQWFCLISWKLFSGWTSYFGIMTVWPDIWPPNICRSLWPMFHGPLNLPFILTTVWCMNIILSDYESVWHDIWPRNKCRSLWPIFSWSSDFALYLK